VASGEVTVDEAKVLKDLVNIITDSARELREEKLLQKVDTDA